MGKKLGLFANGAPNANSSWVENNGINPYSKAIVGDKEITTEVTSIPSPYARMHLFEIAFRQLAVGAAVSQDLRKCAAHCLDVFELLFRCNGDKLRSNNVIINLHKYKDVLGIADGSVEYKYLDALCTFRYGYGNSLFKVFFTISHGTDLIAATSPFTGFYVREDNKVSLCIDGYTYFAQKELDDTGQSLWLSLAERGDDFKKFLYMLVKYLRNQNINNFSERYEDLWSYVDKQITPNEQALWNTHDFAADYPQYDFASLATKGYGFPIFTRNPVWDGQNVCIIPNAYDCSFFKYLLLPEENASFNLSQDDYKSDILERRNPIDNTPLKWVSIDDFLDDTVVKIQGEINSDKYFTVKDEQNNICSLIPPLKKRFFEFFNINDIEGPNHNVIFRLECDNRFDWCNFTVEVPYISVGGNIGYLTLTKTYKGEQILKNSTIELGIYPFIKTPVDINDFYRILVYASKDLSFQNLEVVKFDNNHYISDGSILAPDGMYIRKKVKNAGGLSMALQSDLVYYSLESTFIEQVPGLRSAKNVSFDILNLKYSIAKPTGTVDKELLVVPLMKEVTLTSANVCVAVDLGTSNTYVAYSIGENTYPFETITNHLGDVQFVKLSKPTESTNKERYDFDGQYAITQLCEFMPAYFAVGNTGNHFPTPTMLNVADTTDTSLREHSVHPLVSLFDVNIPFSYYEVGKRSLGGISLDNIVQDFKWILPHDQKKVGELSLYIDQLCLMIRTTLLAKGVDIRGASLYYTYPLSFDGNLVTLYHAIWIKAYAKYFNITSNPLFIANPANYQSVASTYVHAATESKTPVYSDAALHGGAGKIISADIGGGSTDVMIYNSATHSAEFCMSFKFAGDNMFGLNEVINRDNVWFTDVANKVIPVSVNVGSGVAQNKISPDENNYDIKHLMNNGFSNPILNSNIVTHSAGSNGCSLITVLYSSAILYQLADACRAKNCLPEKVFFSGNGSNLLFFTQANHAGFSTESCLETVTKKVFSHFFPNKRDFINGMGFSIIKSSDPKAATAEGVLQAFIGGITVDVAADNHFVSYGEKDAKSLYLVPNIIHPIAAAEPFALNVSHLLNDYNGDKEIYNNIIANVKSFLQLLFTDIIPYFKNLAESYAYNEENEAEIIDGKKNIYYILSQQWQSFDKGYSEALNGVTGTFHDSLFLSVISKIIIDLCKALK